MQIERMEADVGLKGLRAKGYVSTGGDRVVLTDEGKQLIVESGLLAARKASFVQMTTG